MALHVHSLCGYPSLGAFKKGGYKPDKTHWVGYNLVKCAKGETFKGYSDITFNGQNHHIDSNSRPVVIDLFGKWGATKLSILDVADVDLVPIPSSKLTIFGADCTAKLLADSVSKHLAGSKVSHVLAFKEARDSDHGKRETETSEKPKRQSKDEIFKNLKSGTLPKSGRRIVLVDDVCTQGFHLLATAAFLRNHGLIVDHALCLGRTVWEPAENVLAMPPEDLEATLFAFFED